jgi:hypothetical protein
MIFDLVKVFSYSETGEMMGTSKSAIAGFIFRNKHKQPPEPRVSSPHAHTVKKVINIVPAMPETNKGITIFELKNDSCRYMIGNHKYCGHKVFRLSNCEKHFKECRRVKRNKDG